jgi:hypothetical protein
VLDWLRDEKVSGTFVGGVAAILHGYIRTTNDVDVQIYSTLPEGEILDSLLSHGFEFLPRATREVTLQVGIESHVLPVTLTSTGVKTDVMLGSFPFIRDIVEESDIVRWRGRAFRIASLNYLLVTKLVAGRPRDLLDVRSLLEMHEGRIDKPWVMSRVSAIALDMEAPERIEVARELLRL